MKKTLFIKNAAIMTASSFLLRVLGLLFKIRVASMVGDTGIGLYQVIFSVHLFASSFAAAGLCTAVTRLCANADAKGENPRPILKKCLLISFFLGVVIYILISVFADFAAQNFIGEIKSAVCIRIICVSLPFMGISSCYRGYFIALRKATPCAFSQILEQIVRIFLSYFLVKKYLSFGVIACCSALVAGDAAAEILCAFYLFLRAKAEKSPNTKDSGYSYAAIFRIAFPLTCGKYGGTLLRTAENILVPKALSKSGGGIKGGLALFGNIKGMALPVLLFPAGIIGSLSQLIIPEISSASACGRKAVVKELCEQLIKLTLLFSVFFAAFFAETGEMVGNLLYKSKPVGFLLLVLSPLIPLMYIDSVSDGLLKGLDCQRFCFWLNLSDSGIRVLLVPFLLPRFGMPAFIAIMYFSNFYTAALNFLKLVKKSGAKIDPFKSVFIPLVAALGVTKITSHLLAAFALPDAVFLSLTGVISAAVYMSLLFAFKIADRDFIRSFS